MCVCKCVFIGCIRITNNLRSPSVYLDPWTIFFFSLSLSHSFCVCFGFYFSVLFLKVIACITYNCVQKSVNLLLSAVGVVIWHFINDFWYLPRNADLTLISHTQNDLTKSTSTSVDKLNFDDFFGKVWMKHPTTPKKKKSCLIFGETLCYLFIRREFRLKHSFNMKRKQEQHISWISLNFVCRKIRFYLIRGKFSFCSSCSSTTSGEYDKIEYHYLRWRIHFVSLDGFIFLSHFFLSLSLLRYRKCTFYANGTAFFFFLGKVFVNESSLWWHWHFFAI